MTFYVLIFFRFGIPYTVNRGYIVNHITTVNRDLEVIADLARLWLAATLETCVGPVWEREFCSFVWYRSIYGKWRPWKVS